TSGPGASNTVTGLATAFMDSIPLICITGNASRSLIGRDSFQEIDIMGITMPITKHNFVVRDAFKIANTGRKGPVLIDIPSDIMAEEFEYEKKPSLKDYKKKDLDIKRVKKIASCINK